MHDETLQDEASAITDDLRNFYLIEHNLQATKSVITSKHIEQQDLHQPHPKNFI